MKLLGAAGLHMNWHEIQFTAQIAMPTSKTIPALVFFDWPSP